jgi:hypothetical protein
MPICKNSKAAISLVTHCRLLIGVVESLLMIDRKGRCFDRLDVIAGIARAVAIAVATAAVVVIVLVLAEVCTEEAAVVTVVAPPNVTALFALGIPIPPLALVAGDKEGSR